METSSYLLRAIQETKSLAGAGRSQTFWAFVIGGHRKAANTLRESLAADLALEVQRLQGQEFNQG